MHHLCSEHGDHSNGYGLCQVLASRHALLHGHDDFKRIDNVFVGLVDHALLLAAEELFDARDNRPDDEQPVRQGENRVKQCQRTHQKDSFVDHVRSKAEGSQGVYSQRRKKVQVKD